MNLDNLTSTEITRCPNCSAEYRPGQVECKQCGIVFRKFDDRLKFYEIKKRESSFDVSPELRNLWEEVILQYEVLDVHQTFVAAAWAEGALDYAAMKYRTILEAVPQDDMAKRLTEEIKALTLQTFEVIADSKISPIVEPMKKGVLSHFNFSFRNFQFINLIFIGCGIMMVTGYFVPGMRNLIGFGSSILFFVLLLRYYFKII